MTNLDPPRALRKTFNLLCPTEENRTLALLRLSNICSQQPALDGTICCYGTELHTVDGAM